MNKGKSVLGDGELVLGDLNKQTLLNGDSQFFYFNQEACAAQIRTIMRAAGLASEKLPHRRNLLSSNITASHLSSQKMTLMSELFASEEEDGDEDEVYQDDIDDDPTDIEAHQLGNHVEYVDDGDDEEDDEEEDDEEEEEEEDDDEEDDEEEDEEIPFDEIGEEGDDEEEYDEEESLLDSKFTLTVDPSNFSSDPPYNDDIELHFTEFPDSAPNVTNGTTDSQLLLYASASGHDDMVQLILTTQKVDVNRRGPKEMTPLMEAASGGHIDIVRLLLNYGADVSCKTKQGNTVLMYACAMGHLEVVKELIIRGANIEDQNENGHTPLMEAASAGHVEVARFLVSQGCNIYVHSNEYKETALTLAAYKGHLDMVRFLINAGADRENRAEEMHTALMEASMDGHVEVARLLIDSGAEVNMPPDSFESPLTLAACGGHVELALLLIERGANIEEVNDEGYTALMEAAREGHEEMVALLIRHGAQVNATTEESKETALFMAAGTGCLEVVNLLIKAGADLELGTSTPLLEASQEGHVLVVKRLLEANANPNAKNSAGESPLTVAADNGYPGVIKLLLDAGAEVDYCPEGGKTALMKAASNNHAEAVQLLISANAQVNRTTSNNEQTALSLACKEGATAVVEILLNSGADLFHRLKDNSTMLIEAAKNGHTAIVQMLIDYHYLPIAASSSEQDMSKLGELYNSVVNCLSPETLDADKKPICLANDGGLFNYTTASTIPEAQYILESGSFQIVDHCGQTKTIRMPDIYDMFPPKDASEFYRKILYTRQLLPQKASSTCGPTTQATTNGDDHHPDDEYASRLSLAGCTDSEVYGSCNNNSIGKSSKAGNANSAVVNSDKQPYSQKDSLAVLRKTLSSLVFDENFTIETELPVDFDAATIQEKMDITAKALALQSTGVLPTDVSKAFSLSQLPVTIPSQFFDFRSLFVKKEPKLGISTSATTITHVCNSTATPVVVQPAAAPASAPTSTQVPASTLHAATATSKTTDVFKRNKSCKSVQASKTSISVSSVAATVSINTNTTSTATTAVCNLLPQSAQAESVAFTPSPSLSIAQPLSASMATSTAFMTTSSNVASKVNLLTSTTTTHTTATTKSNAKSKNAAGSKKAHSSDQVTGKKASNKTCQGHSQSCPAANSTQTSSGQTAKSAKQQSTTAPSLDLNSQTDSNHDTALTVACAGGHVDLVKLLLARGADIEHREKKGLSPLMLAATNGHAKIVEILFSHGADLEAQTERTKDTALSLACSSGRYEVVEILLARGANKEHRNVSDYTPLSLAASGGYVPIINLLLSHQAEINSRTGSKLGISPLMLAAMNGHTEASRVLLDRGSDINAYIETNRNTALTLACFQGRTEVVALLVDRNANIEHRAKTGLTPLMEAASGGYVDVGKVLLDKGADVNAPPVSASKDTALTIAADKGHAAFVKLLIERNASVDVKNKKGYSPLWLACNGGHFDVATILVDAKCDVDSQDNRKISCLMAAFRRGHVKIVKFLVKHVTQFPSDQEIDRCLALCADEELNKKAALCAEILHQAKERQAAEAYKNAANLLEEIDQERTREESRKAAAARRRERRKQKKKADKNDAFDDISEKFDESESKNDDNFLKDDESRDEEAPAKPKKKKKKADKNDAFDDISEKFDESESKNDDNFLKDDESRDEEAPAKPKKKKNKKSKKSSFADFSDLDSLHEDSSWNDAAFTTVNKSSRKHARRQQHADSAGTPTQIAASALSKREDDWKEVVRKSKKVLVPSNAISRVIGRGGCNINTIREVSGAHIEVEKQKGQGDRMVIIRGSADATRHAHTLITVLSKETEKELVEIIRELGLDSLCTSSTTTIPINTATNAATSSVSIVHETAANGSSSTAPSSVVHENTDKELSTQCNLTNQVAGSSARVSKIKAAVSSGVKSATTSYAVSNPTMIFTSSSLSKTSKSPSSMASLDTVNWTNSYGKAAATQAAITSSASNTASYTMAINAKTRNPSNTTTVASKVSPSEAELRTISPLAPLTTVLPESVEQLVQRDSSQRNTPTMQMPRLPSYSMQPPQPQQPSQQNFATPNLNLVDGLSFDSPNQMSSNHYKAITSSASNTASYMMAINAKTRNPSNTTTVASKVSPSEAELRTISPLAPLTTVLPESVEQLVQRDSSQRNTPTMQMPRLPSYSMQPPQPQQPSQQKFATPNLNLVDGLSFDSPNQMSSNHYKSTVGNSLFPSQNQFAGSISNTAVRAAIVNYSMNLFQNQVPKQHQEAASRLAHLSAQNSNFVGNEFQNVFIGSNGSASNSVGISSNTINTNGVTNAAPVGSQRDHEKSRMMPYAYQSQYKPSLSMSSSTNTNTYAQSQQSSQYNSSFGQPGPFGAVGGVRNSVSSSITTPLFSSINYVNTFDPLNLNTVPSNLFSTPSLGSAANSELDDCIQRTKQPAPIGTERAQRKNPLHAFGSTSQGNHGNIGNQGAMSSNSLFSDRHFPWSTGSGGEFNVQSAQDPIFPINNHLSSSSFNNDYSELFPGPNSSISNLPELGQFDSYSVLNRQSSHQTPYNLQQQQQQQKFNSINFLNLLNFLEQNPDA